MRLKYDGHQEEQDSREGEGSWRRIILIPFSAYIPSEERRPMSELLRWFWAEKEGILNWAD